MMTDPKVAVSTADEKAPNVAVEAANGDGPKITIEMKGGASGIPIGGKDGQVLVNRSGKAYWADPVRADLTVNDPTDPRYVAGRLAYRTDEGVVELLPETLISIADSNEEVTLTLEDKLLPGNMYRAVFDGAAYECTAAESDDGTVYIGCPLSATSPTHPFTLYCSDTTTCTYCLRTLEAGEHSLAVADINNAAIVPVSEEFIPPEIARVRDVKPFYVTFTRYLISEDELGNKEYTIRADKTYDEVFEAIKKDLYVVAVYKHRGPEYNGYYIPLVDDPNVSQYSITFRGFTLENLELNYNYVILELSRLNNVHPQYRQVAYIDNIPYALPNPQALVIRAEGSPLGAGERYDGSKQVEIEIPTSMPWGAITNKPFYDNSTIIPETTLTAFASNVIPITEPVGALTVGDEYTLTYNGVNYKSNAFNFEMEGLSGVSIGNPFVVGGEDNGAPVLFIVFPEPLNENDVLIYALLFNLYGEYTEGEQITISVSGAGGLKTLESKYLPTATTTEKGGIIVGDGLWMNKGKLFVSAAYIQGLVSSSGYQTKTQVETLINEALGGVENGTY